MSDLIATKSKLGFFGTITLGIKKIQSGRSMN